MKAIEELAPAEDRQNLPQKEIRVGIAGYGTVGRATAQSLTRNAQEIR